MIPRTPARDQGYIVNEELNKCGIEVHFPIVYGDEENEYKHKYVKCSNECGNGFYVMLDDSVYVESDHLVCFQLSDPKSNISDFSKELIKLFHRDISGLAVEISDSEELTEIEIDLINNDGSSVCSDVYRFSDRKGDLEVHYPIFRLTEILMNPDEINDSIDKYWNFLYERLADCGISNLDTLVTNIESTLYSIKAIKRYLDNKLYEKYNGKVKDTFNHNENLLEIFKQVASLLSFADDVSGKRAYCRAIESRCEQFYKHK